MGTKLLQIVQFTEVAPAAVVVLPHQINVNGVAQAPDYVAANASDFTVAVTSTTVTVTNNGTTPASVDVWLELKHTTERQLGSTDATFYPSLIPRPFVIVSSDTSNGTGGGGGGGGGNTFLTVNPTPQFGDIHAISGFVNLLENAGKGASIFLPPAAASGPEAVVAVSGKTGGWTFVPDGTDTIVGQSEFVLAGVDNYASYTILMSDGISNWVIVATSLALTLFTDGSDVSPPNTFSILNAVFPLVFDPGGNGFATLRMADVVPNRQPFATDIGVSGDVPVNDGYVNVLATTGLTNAVLTTAAASLPGIITTVKSHSSSVGAITVVPFAGDTIDGAATYALATAKKSVTLQSDSTSNWNVIAVV